MILYLLSGIVQYYLEWLCWTAQLKTTLVSYILVAVVYLCCLLFLD